MWSGGGSGGGGFQQFQLIMFFTARTNVNNEECLITDLEEIR